jgi:hypothetical protein
VKKPATLVHNVRDLPKRLDRADLVVREHNRDKDRIGPNRSTDRVRINATIAIHGDQRDLKSRVALEVFARVQDGVMLDRGRHDVAPTLPRGKADALQRKVIALAPAAREHDLCRATTKNFRASVTGTVHRPTGVASESVGARRIAVTRREKGKHRFEDRGVNRRRGRVIEIQRC